MCFKLSGNRYAAGNWVKCNLSKFENAQKRQKNEEEEEKKAKCLSKRKRIPMFYRAKEG